MNETKEEIYDKMFENITSYMKTQNGINMTSLIHRTILTIWIFVLSLVVIWGVFK